MDKKIIFFDIDGTLLDQETSTIPQSAIHAIEKAMQNGHYCFINTGRPKCTLDQSVLDIPFDGYICGCGTYIEYQNKQILHNNLSKQARQETIHAIYDSHSDAILEGKQAIYFSKNTKHPELDMLDGYYKERGFPVFEFDRDDDIDFDKMTIWFHKDTDVDMLKSVLEKYFDIIQRADDMIEVIPHNYSKASAIQFMTDYLNLSHDQTISIGDSTNDLSMLEFTKESVAMGNSHPALFDVVTYTTTDIMDNGIYNALKHFNLL